MEWMFPTAIAVVLRSMMVTLIHSRGNGANYELCTLDVDWKDLAIVGGSEDLDCETQIMLTSFFCCKGS